MRRLYAGTDSLLDDDPNVDYPAAVLAGKAGDGKVGDDKVGDRSPSGHVGDSRLFTTKVALTGDAAARRSAAHLDSSAAHHRTMTIPLGENPLGEGVDIELVYIPAGRFVMGQADSFPDEQPLLVTIEKPFFMARTEITNAQFALFDPSHDSRIEFGDFMHFSPGEQGWSLSHPAQPVVRVSWDRAVAFCDWLSQKTGKMITLPTEAQWEYAARGEENSPDMPFWYGTLDTDFSPFANLSDINNQQISDFGWLDRSNTIPAWRPADVRFNDHSRVSAPVGSYTANPFGLFDMHGNVAEWVADAPVHAPEHRIVKGGSWYDPPHRARTAFKQHYLAEQQIFDVGFRVIVLTE